MGQFDHGPFGISEKQQVGLGIHEHGTTHRLGPIIKMSNAPQTGLDPTDDDRNSLEGFAGTLGIDGDRVVWPSAGRGVRGIGVVGARTPIGGVAVHHGVHVAGGDAEEEVRPSQSLEIGGRGPIRLSDDADAEPLRLQETTDDGHAKGRMIDIGVASDDDDIATVPAQQIHFGPGDGQFGRRAELMGPVLAIGEEVRGGFHRCECRADAESLL